MGLLTLNMTREELFKYIEEVDDLKKDYAKILSNLHYTHFYLMDKYRKILGSYNLTFTQSNILGIIVHAYPKGLSLEQIKEMVLEPNSDVSRTVVRLMSKKFVEKSPDPHNRRKVCIKATDAGLKMVRKMAADRRFQAFTKNLSLASVKTLISVLKSLRGN
jgi:DNA-binding MarR family transcriptional regulator